MTASAVLDGWLGVAAFAGAVVAANVLSVGEQLPVGFGLVAPAGVYLAGLTFSLRDLVHESLGRHGVLVAITLGAGLSWLAATPRLAAASAAAFAASELADTSVYTLLRQRSLPLAIAASNAAGLLLDSVTFVWLALGSGALLAGQILGKAWMTGLALLLVLILRCSWRRRWRS